MDEKRLLDERESANRLGLSLATLRRRRARGLPPAWVCLGKRILYRAQDLDDLIEASLVRPAANEDQR